MKFKYKTYTDGENLNARPIIPIRLSSGKSSLQYEVLIDSGADVSIFDIGIAEALGIDVTKGVMGKFGGVTGEQEIMYNHPLAIEVGGWSFDATANFATMPNYGYGIVGQADYFKFFIVKMTYEKMEIELMTRQ